MMKTVFFDLDGTLIDHFEAIAHGVNHAAKALQRPTVALNDVKAAVGGAVPRTLTRLLGSEYLDDALPHFYEGFESVYLEKVRVLPGAAWILGALRSQGKTLAVLTNKDTRFARPLLESTQLAHLLDGIYGTEGDGLRKPDPAFTRRALLGLDAAAESSVLIGDSPFDSETAAEAGLPVYLVASGSHSLEALSNEAPANGYYENLFQLGHEVFGIPLPDPHSC